MKLSGPVMFDEPMALHTSFKVGGPADIYAIPADLEDLKRLVSETRRQNAPLFPLGAGANILVADKGIRGIVIDLSGLNECGVSSTTIHAQAGCSMSSICELAANNALSGLEFIYAMPGSVGGSVWMNARCYGREVADVLEYVDVLTRDAVLKRAVPERRAFSYKNSPFQTTDSLIVAAGFALRPGNSDSVLQEMHLHRSDRDKKGHFFAPSVGSVFKNNRAFGHPTGKIIDILGLRGHRLGGAQISNLHANIVFNIESASAADILNLIEYMEARVKEEFGFLLEREVLLIGDW